CGPDGWSPRSRKALDRIRLTGGLDTWRSPRRGAPRVCGSPILRHAGDPNLSVRPMPTPRRRRIHRPPAPLHLAGAAEERHMPALRARPSGDLKKPARLHTVAIDDPRLGGLMHLSDGHDLGEVAFAVASYLENADGVLAKVLGRLGHDSARDIVEKSRQALRDLGQELEFLSLMTEPGELRGSWVLNPRWHTVAFDVASSNDTVLLTVAINAVRVIQQIWDRLLDDRWPPDVRDLLKSQRKRICEVEESLLEA